VQEISKDLANRPNYRNPRQLNSDELDESSSSSSSLEHIFENEKPGSTLQWCGFITHAQKKREKKYPRQLVKTLQAFTSPGEKRAMKFFLILTDGCEEGYSDIQAISSWVKIVCIKQPHEQLQQLDPATRTAPPKYGDSLERELWRSKMGLDFVHGLGLCEGADVIMALEDDMVASFGFFETINAFVERRLKERIPFSLIKLFAAPPKETSLSRKAPAFTSRRNPSERCVKYTHETRALVLNGHFTKDLAVFVKDNFSQAPHDWLIRDFFKKTCSHIFSPSLFQHTGLKSTNDVNTRNETAPDFNQWGE